jgi:purine-binding chemotaxis protein CheW
MEKSHPLVIFDLDELRVALYLSVVERVLRVVEVSPLPKAPEIIRGIINVQGRLLPVVNIRKRFRRPERDTVLSDQLLIARMSNRTVALVVDRVSDVIERSAEATVEADRILPGMEYVEGVVKLDDGLVLIHNLDTFLSLEESAALDRAMSKP